MQVQDKPEAGKASGPPGLVLHYAPSWPQLEPAYPFVRPVMTAGTAPGLDIVVPVRAVSERHACFMKTATGWRVADTQSRNGVLVNGQRVSEHALSPGDQVRLGDALFGFVERDADAYQRYRIDGARRGESAEGSLARSTCPIVGGRQMDALVRDIERVGPAVLPVVLVGETGTGKEVFANFLHTKSRRRGPFHAVNCAAIPQNLAEGELFGWVRGAFSGAVSDNPGHLRAADGGTLFLDEVAELSLELQAKLLRAIQFKQVTPLGSQAVKSFDVRFVCAAQEPLEGRVAAGRFRADLYARLKGFVLRIPPLRERKEDIFFLVRTFLGRSGRAGLQPTMGAMTALLEYSYPMNVRELETAIERAVLLAEGPELCDWDLPEEMREGRRTSTPHERTSESAETGSREASGAGVRENPDPGADVLRALLAAHHGNWVAIARASGYPRSSLQRWCAAHGLDAETYRAR
jgi:DNA-binding NtrC family response regulator